MSQRQAPYRTTPAFPEPNYTQTPNNFFAMLPDMEASEVRVTLVMIRETFGYHRESFTMGIGKLADAAGLSRGAAKDGAEAAEKRGTFRRSNPDAQTEAEWELVVGQPLTPFTECIGDGQPLTVTPPLVDPQVGVKERKKEIKWRTPLSIENQIAAGAEQVTLPDQMDARRWDIAQLIGMGEKSASIELAYAFMKARDILIPESKIKGQRKAVREMIEMGVQPEHVTEAVRQLLAKNMTVIDLFSVSKTAQDIANKPAEKIEYTRML